MRIRANTDGSRSATVPWTKYMFQCMVSFLSEHYSVPVPVLFEFESSGHVSLRILLLSELVPGHVQFLSLSLLNLFHCLPMSF
jgi:hypothetical protein